MGLWSFGAVAIRGCGFLWLWPFGVVAIWGRGHSATAPNGHSPKRPQPQIRRPREACGAVEKERFFLERKCLEEVFSRGWGEGGLRYKKGNWRHWGARRAHPGDVQSAAARTHGSALRGGWGTFGSLRMPLRCCARECFGRDEGSTSLGSSKAVNQIVFFGVGGSGRRPSRISRLPAGAADPWLVLARVFVFWAPAESSHRQPVF